MDRPPVTLTSARGRIGLTLTAVPMGRDLCVALYGGDAPHVGAVALSQSRPSLTADGGTSATTSVIAVLGHKEDELAREIAAVLASRLGCVATVTCGIHLDAATLEELGQILEMSRELTRRLVDRLAPAGA